MEKKISVADFKRKLVVGAKLKSQFLLTNRIMNNEIKEREVVHVQSNSFAMTSANPTNLSSLTEAKANPHKNASWLQYPKASEISVDSEGWIVISDCKGVPFVRYLFE